MTWPALSKTLIWTLSSFPAAAAVLPNCPVVTSIVAALWLRNARAWMAALPLRPVAGFAPASRYFTAFGMGWGFAPYSELAPSAATHTRTRPLLFILLMNLSSVDLDASEC